MSKLDDEILALDESHLTELSDENLNGEALRSRDARQVPYPRNPSRRWAPPTPGAERQRHHAVLRNIRRIVTRSPGPRASGATAGS